MSRLIIRLHTDAPAKPRESAPCNGCAIPFSDHDRSLTPALRVLPYYREPR